MTLNILKVSLIHLAPRVSCLIGMASVLSQISSEPEQKENLSINDNASLMILHLSDIGSYLMPIEYF